jgi:hypothetical protein
MKTIFTKLSVLSIFALSLTAMPAMADADDDKWIAKCVKDNKDEGAKESVVLKYCTCMNDKMDKSETASITTWEKTHKKETAECSKEAGWK